MLTDVYKRRTANMTQVFNFLHSNLSSEREYVKSAW